MKQQGSYEKLFNYYNKEQKILKNQKKVLTEREKADIMLRHLRSDIIIRYQKRSLKA